MVPLALLAPAIVESIKGLALSRTSQDSGWYPNQLGRGAVIESARSRPNLSLSPGFKVDTENLYGGEGGIRTPGATRAHVISSHAG
jgi:hypothetical protein